MNKAKYIILSVFTLLSILLIVFFIWPYFIDIASESNNLISSKLEIVKSGLEADEAHNFEANYDSYLPGLKRIDQSFVDADNPINFIEFLEDTAAKLDLSIEVYPSPSSSSVSGFVDYHLSSSGSFSDAMSFIESIERGPYLVNIKNTSITSSKTDKNSSKELSGIVDTNLLMEVLTK